MALEPILANSIKGHAMPIEQPDGYTEKPFHWHQPLLPTPDNSDTESDIDDMMSDIVGSSIRAVDSLMSEDESSLLSDTSHISEGVWSFPTEQNPTEQKNDIIKDGNHQPENRCLESLPDISQTPSAGHEGEAIFTASPDELLSEDEHTEEGHDAGVFVSMEGANEDDTESLYDF